MKHIAYAVLPTVALLSFPMLGNAQQQTNLKEAIVGTWVVQDVANRRPDGSVQHPWGNGVTGHFVFTADGGYTQVLIGGSADPARKTADPRHPDKMTIGYVGTYTVDPDNKTLHVKLDRAANSIRDGARWDDSVAMNGDDMVITGGIRTDQAGSFTPLQMLKRFKH